MGAAALLGRTGDRTSKTQETKLNVRRMFEDGTIDLPRLQRSMGALHSKVNVMKKKRLARARAGGVLEEEAEARVQDGGLAVMLDRNTRGVLASITEEQGEEEVGQAGRGGPGRGSRSRRGVGGPRGGVGGRGGPGGNGREARGGRGRETGVRGWEHVGPNKRRCLYCGGEYSNRYMFTHLRELCRGGHEDEELTTTEEDEALAEEATTTDDDDGNESSEEDERIEADDIIQEVEELERTVIVERNLGARRKRRVSSSSSSSSTPGRQPLHQRQRVTSPVLYSPYPGLTSPNLPAPHSPVVTPPPATTSHPTGSQYHISLGPQLRPRSVEGREELSIELWAMSELSTSTADLINNLMTEEPRSQGDFLDLDLII